MSDAAAVNQADWVMRNWSGPEPGNRIRIGSEQHKQLFCRMLLDTHNPYKPAVIEWPKLSPDELKRITSLPIWDIAVQTEGRASIRVKTFAERVRDPLLRSALDMDAGEEARHKVVLSKLVEFYGIRLAPEPDYLAPKDSEWAWLVTGYSECIDSLFSFGLFHLARSSGIFPEELADTFEPVIQEEARHIIFFANWVAWYRRNLPFWRRPLLWLRIAAVWCFLGYERIGIARGIDDKGDMQDANFAVNGSEQLGIDINLREFFELCLRENDRRMAGYDPRLLRPTTMPRLVRLLLPFLSKRKK
jgi:hypothetical protein